MVCHGGKGPAAGGSADGRIGLFPANRYQSAADKGNAAAQYALGQVYEHGHLDLKKDKAQALTWYQKAAAQGFGDAAKKVRDLSK